MTVQNVIVKNIASGNGSTRQWPFTFACPVEHPDYVKVYIKDADGNVNLTEDFTVDMNTKKVTYPVAGSVLAAGEKIVIARELPLHQLLNLVNQGPFFAEDLEVTYDEIVMMIQQLNEKLGRVLSVSVDVDSANDINLTVPLEAGYGWRVSDDGKSIVALSNPEGVYADTVGVYNTAVADTTAIKNQTETIKNAAGGYKDAAAASATSAGSYADSAEDYSNLSKAWAESSTSPDGNINSKSSKSWAANAASNAADAALSANYCKALAADGAVYNASTTYDPGDAAMTPEGNLWRCIAESTGENPSTSGKWVLVSVVNSNTFEPDENGDLMPLMYPKQSSQFDIDENGDIEPAL